MSCWPDKDTCSEIDDVYQVKYNKAVNMDGNWLPTISGGAGGLDVAAISDLLPGFGPGAGGASGAQAANNGLLEGTPGILFLIIMTAYNYYRRNDLEN